MIFGRLLVAACFSALSASVLAEGEEEAWSVRFQSTYVRQAKPAFDAAYSGPLPNA